MTSDTDLRVVVIDPDNQTLTDTTVSDATVTAFLESLRGLLGANLLANIPAGPGQVIWLDGLGMLKRPRSYWSLPGGDQFFAGRAVVTGIDSQGMPASASFVGSVDWHPGKTLNGIVQSLAVQTLPDGSPFPSLVQSLDWDETKPAAAPKPGIAIWRVLERADGSYHAVQYDVSGDTVTPAADVESIEGVTLEEIRRQLPPGLELLLPEDTDPINLIETWM